MTRVYPKALTLTLACALFACPLASYAQGATSTSTDAETTARTAHLGSTSLQTYGTSAQQMSVAAQALLAALSEEEGVIVRSTLQDPARANWSNLPASMVERNGLRVGDLTDAQRILLHDLIRASTSSQGYQKIAGIIRLDDLLHEDAGAAVASGERQLPPGLLESWTSENYWFSFFGEPGRDTDWGWLLSGHHLGASFTVSGERVGFTPLFLGAEPNVVLTGPYAGWQALQRYTVGLIR